MKHAILCVVALIVGVGSAMADDSWPPDFGAEGRWAKLVWRVEEGGNADLCGLRGWDLIIKIDGIFPETMLPSVWSGRGGSLPEGTSEYVYLRPSLVTEEFTQETATCSVPDLKMGFIPVFLVDEVPADSAAAALGMQPGDLVGRLRPDGSAEVWRRNPRFGEEGEYIMKRHLLTEN